MEIREIVEFYYNDTTNILEITFRTNEDDEDYVRYDEIPMKESIDFGFDFIKEERNYFFDEEYDDDYSQNDDESNLDYSEIISFLNEYYIFHPEKLPESESY